MAACLNSGAANTRTFVESLLSMAPQAALRDLWTPLVGIAAASRDWPSVGALADWLTKRSGANDSTLNQGASHVLESINLVNPCTRILLEGFFKSILLLIIISL